MSFTLRDTPDKVYYDVVISNITSGGDQPPPDLYFNETRNSPLIINPESYYLSIVRFTLDTTTLPIIQPVIQPNQGNRNLTVYSFTLSYGGTDAQEFLIYEPQNMDSPLPAPPSQTQSTFQNNLSGYYDIYSAQFFIALVNKTLLAAYNSLDAAYSGTLPSIYAPVMTWDTASDSAILNADKNGYDDLSTAPGGYIQIYMNANMYNLFSSFPVIIEGYSPSTVGKNVRIATNSLGGSNIIKFPPYLPSLPSGTPPSPAYAYDAIQVIQEYSTLAVWTPITSIVFTSNTLPIVPNQVSAPLIFLEGKRFQSGGNNADIAQVITDFVADNGIYKPFIKYNPTAQYRLISLVGNTPIYNIDVEVAYKNRLGQLIPFKISSGSSATIKFLFTRKGTEGDLYIR